MSHAFRQLAHEEGLLWYEDIANMQKLDGRLQKLPEVLNQLQAGRHILITHPAYAEAETHAVVGQSYFQPGELAQERLQDYQVLCDPQVMRIVRERKIHLARYDEFLS